MGEESRRIDTTDLVARARQHAAGGAMRDARGLEQPLDELSRAINAGLEDMAQRVGDPSVAVTGRFAGPKRALIRAVAPMSLRQREIDAATLEVLTNLADQVALLRLRVEGLSSAEVEDQAGVEPPSSGEAT
jgi:hypothetical protein